MREDSRTHTDRLQFSVQRRGNQETFKSDLRHKLTAALSGVMNVRNSTCVIPERGGTGDSVLCRLVFIFSTMAVSPSCVYSRRMATRVFILTSG